MVFLGWRSGEVYVPSRRHVSNRDLGNVPVLKCHIDITYKSSLNVTTNTFIIIIVVVLRE